MERRYWISISVNESRNEAEQMLKVSLSLKTKTLIQSKFLDRYFESKIYLLISRNGKISRLGTWRDYRSHAIWRGIEGTRRGGLNTCTITRLAPAVVPHKIWKKKLMGSDLYWSTNNQRVFGFGNYHELLRVCLILLLLFLYIIRARCFELYLKYILSSSADQPSLIYSASSR